MKLLRGLAKDVSTHVHVHVHVYLPNCTKLWSWILYCFLLFFLPFFLPDFLSYSPSLHHLPLLTSSLPSSLFPLLPLFNLPPLLYPPNSSYYPSRHLPQGDIHICHSLIGKQLNSAHTPHHHHKHHDRIHSTRSKKEIHRSKFSVNGNPIIGYVPLSLEENTKVPFRFWFWYLNDSFYYTYKVV